MFSMPVYKAPPIPPYDMRRKWYMDDAFKIAVRAGYENPKDIAKQAGELFDDLYGPNKLDLAGIHGQHENLGDF